jgi:hypothetical protein
LIVGQDAGEGGFFEQTGIHLSSKNPTNQGRMKSERCKTNKSIKNYS